MDNIKEDLEEKQVRELAAKLLSECSSEERYYYKALARELGELESYEELEALTNSSSEQPND